MPFTSAITPKSLGRHAFALLNYTRSTYIAQKVTLIR